MKKIVLAVMAVAAIGFTSCGNKTQQGEAVDSVAIIDSIAQGAAQETIDALAADIEAGDAGKLQQTLEAVKAQIAEIVKNNPEVAKEYVAKVQTFLKDNADKVKAVVGENAVAAAALSAVTEVEPQSVVDGLLQSVGDAKDAAVDAADAAKDAAIEKAEAAKDAAVQAAEDKANEAKEAAKQKASDAVDNAAAAAKSKLGL